MQCLCNGHAVILISKCLRETGGENKGARGAQSSHIVIKINAHCKEDPNISTCTYGRFSPEMNSSYLREDPTWIRNMTGAKG